jgi:Sec-independent protein translocase protein TatA
MLKVLLELFVLYMLYKLIFDFIIPIYQTTKQVKKKVNEMQNNMNEQVNRQQQNQFTAAAKEAAPKPKGDDYIEFEEVK